MEAITTYTCIYISGRSENNGLMIFFRFMVASPPPPLTPIIHPLTYVSYKYAANFPAIFHPENRKYFNPLGGMDGWMNQAYSRLSTTHGHITDCKLLVCMYWTRLVPVRPAASLYSASPLTHHPRVSSDVPTQTIILTPSRQDGL